MINNNEPKSFSFNEENIVKAKLIIAKYPLNREKSALIPLLDLAQRQNGGWLARVAIEYVAEFLKIPFMRAYEVATFYTMFNLNKVGKYHIQICGTTPCWLQGSQDVEKTCLKKLGIKVGEASADGMFSLTEVECLGACVNAPVMQINDDYYEDLSIESVEQILDDLISGGQPKTGSYRGRVSSEPYKDN